MQKYKIFFTYSLIIRNQHRFMAKILNFVRNKLNQYG